MAPAAADQSTSTPSATADANVVERSFNRIKNWRGLATRYDKHVLIYRGGVILPSILLGLVTQQTTPSWPAPSCGRPSVSPVLPREELMQQAMQVRESFPAERPVRPRLPRMDVAAATTAGESPPREVESRRTAGASVRIVVADDHTLVLDAFAGMLRNVVGFDVVGTVSSSTHVVAAVQQVRPAVLIMNVAMLDTDCLRIVAEVRRAVPTCGIALVAARPTRPLVNRALEAGALSVVPKDARLSHLVMAVRGVAAGCLTVDSALISGSAPEAGQALTSREREVLSLTVKGASVKEIATNLFLSAGTVRNLSSTAIKKTKGRNRFDAALIANEQGWL